MADKEITPKDPQASEVTAENERNQSERYRGPVTGVSTFKSPVLPRLGSTMNAYLPPLTRRTGRAVGIGLLLAVCLTLVFPGHAAAAYYAGSAGQTGSVSLSGPMINAYDVGRPGMYGTTFYSKNFNVGGYSVTRSPSSWSQRVTAVSTIQRWDGRWVDIQSRSFSGNVSGSGSLAIPAWTWSPTGVPNNRSFYRVNYLIGWNDASTGQLVAFTAILPNSYSDNHCNARNLPCTAYTYGLNF